MSIIKLPHDYLTSEYKNDTQILFSIEEGCHYITVKITINYITREAKSKISSGADIEYIIQKCEKKAIEQPEREVIYNIPIDVVRKQVEDAMRINTNNK